MREHEDDSMDRVGVGSRKKIKVISKMKRRDKKWKILGTEKNRKSEEEF